jgi:putative flippase GtrA
VVSGVSFRMGCNTPAVMVMMRASQGRISIRVKNRGRKAMKRFAVFLLVGGANTAVGLTLMIALFHFSGNPYFANSASYAIGFFLSFWLQDSITFGDIKNKSQTRIATYAATYFTAFLANFAFLGICLQFTSLPEILILTLSPLVFVITSYTLMNSLVCISRNGHSQKA